MFNPLTPVVMATTSLKRSFNSNTSCFSNLCLFECIRKYKSKSYLNSLVMTIVKDLSFPKKKLDYLRMKMCKGVCLRRVKVKGLARKWHMRESTIRTNLSFKHEVCFMMKSAFKVMDTCLWYLDNGCSRHMTGDRSLFKVSSLRKVAMSLLVMGASHRLKERESSLYLDYQTLQMFYMWKV